MAKFIKLAHYNKGVEFRVGRWPPIWVHASIFVIVACITSSLWAKWTPGWIAAALIVSLGALFSILAHELGHAWTAEHFGHRPVLIRLHAGGGEAVLQYYKCTRREERMIILAGPLANILLGLACLAAYLIVRPHFAPSYDATLWSGPPPEWELPLVGALRWLGVLNLVWAGVNLLPALPLDGGALLRNWLEERIGERRALLYVSVCGVGLSVLARAVFVVSLLIGPVIWSPPSFRVNWLALKQNRVAPVRFRGTRATGRAR